MADQEPILVNLLLPPSSLARLEARLRVMLAAVVEEAIAKIQMPVPANAPAPPTPKETGLDLKHEERLKAADLRMAVLMGKVPEKAGLLISVKTFAKLLDVSTSTLYRLEAEEALPKAVQVGQLKKWRLAEILEWIDADCPPLSAWSVIRKRGR